MKQSLIIRKIEQLGGVKPYKIDKEKIEDSDFGGLKELKSIDDKTFFEGFELWEGEKINHNDTPLYFLILGS